MSLLYVLLPMVKSTGATRILRVVVFVFVVTWLTEDCLYWQPRTEKGAALTAQLSGLLEDTDDAAVESEKQKIRTIVEKLPYTKNGKLDYFAAAQMEKEK